jgi:hypothetical protein
VYRPTVNDRFRAVQSPQVALLIGKHVPAGDQARQCGLALRKRRADVVCLSRRRSSIALTKGGKHGGPRRLKIILHTYTLTAWRGGREYHN